MVMEVLCELTVEECLIVRSIFEGRLNYDEAFTDLVPDWQSLFLHCIPKIAKAFYVKDWRPIALSSVLQKWFCTCAVVIAQEQLCLRTLSKGFSRGRQHGGF